MAGVPITLSNLANLQNDTTATNTINNNSTAITNSFVSAFNRNGDQMEGSIDMNSNHIYNLPAPATNTEPLRVIDAASLTAGGTINVITRETWPQPMDFGAVGNGVADDSVAIQNLFNSGTDTIYIPSGTYACHNITVPVGVTRIFGTGHFLFNGVNNSTILKFNNFNWDITLDGGLYFDCTTNLTASAILLNTATGPCNGIKINNCRFFGAAYPIRMNDTSGGLYTNLNFHVTNCYFSGFSQGVVLTSNTSPTNQFIFEDNFVDGNGTATSHAIALGVNGNAFHTNPKIINNLFNNVGLGYAIGASNVDNGNISGNTIGMSTGALAGISVTASNGGNVNTLSIENNVVYGIGTTVDAGIRVGCANTNAINAVSNVLIAGNNINNTGAWGIFLFSNGTNTVQQATISGNFIFNPSLGGVFPGIQLGFSPVGGGSVTRCRVVGNVIDSLSANTNVGIFLDTVTSLTETFNNKITVVSPNVSYLDTGTSNTTDMNAAAFVRTYQSSSVSVFVNPSTGSDTLGNGTIGLPFQTISHAYNFVCQNYDGGGTNSVTIRLSNGTYTGTTQQLKIENGLVGFTKLFIVGNPGTPSAVVFDGTGSSNAAFQTGQDCSIAVNVSGIQIQNSVYGFWCTGPGSCFQLQNIIFAGGNGGCHQVQGGVVQYYGPVTFAGANGTGIYVDSNAVFDLNNQNITFSGTPVFSVAFINLQYGGQCQYLVGTITGTCTGMQYNINTGANLIAQSAGVDIFPTNIPGTASTGRITGGWFNNLLGLDVLSPNTGNVGHVSTLPTSPASSGMRSFVTDANSTTFNAIAVGGSSNHVPVFWDGNNWRIG